MESGTSKQARDPNQNAAALWADGASNDLVVDRVSGKERRAATRTPPEQHALPLKDRVALVTGSSRGIGRAIADELMRQGAHCVYNCVSSIEALQRLMFGREGRAGRSVAVQADVSDPQACKRLIDRTMEAAREALGASS